MTTIQPPSYLQAGQHSARSDRLTNGALWAPGSSPLTSRGGVRPGPDGTELAVTAAGVERISISPGTAVIPAGTGGVYVCHSDSTLGLSIAPPHPTLPRRDLVIARVLDSDNGSLLNQWDIVVVAGVPASAAVAPAVPAAAIPLAEVLVRPVGTTAQVGSNDVTDRRGLRAVAVGGLVPATSDRMPDNPYRGMTVACTDVEEIRLWTGGKWVTFRSGEVADQGQWRAYSPELTATGTPPAIGAGGTRMGRYRVDGKTVHFRASFTLGTSYQPGTSVWSVSLPVQASGAVAGPHLVHAHAVDASSATFYGGVAVIEPGAITVSRLTFGAVNYTLGPTHPFVWAVNDSLTVSGTYEAA